MPNLASLIRFVPRRAFTRIAFMVLVAGAVGLLASQRYGLAVAALAGWDAGALLLLGFSFTTFHACDANETHQRAAGDDPGRTVVYVLVTLTSVASLFAATVLSHEAHLIAPTQAHNITPAPPTARRKNSKLLGRKRRIG